MTTAGRGIAIDAAIVAATIATALATLALVVFAVVPADAVEPLERYHLPKELVLVAGAALLCALDAARRIAARHAGAPTAGHAGAAPDPLPDQRRALLFLRRSGCAFDAVDAWCAAVVLASLAACAGAVDVDVALRACTVTAAGVAVFVVLRGGPTSAQNVVFAGVAVVAAAAAVVVVGEALGAWRFAPSGYAPGGTIGQRNNAAHVLAVVAPVVLARTATSRQATARVGYALALAVIVAAVVVTRSRAGWLALGAGSVVCATALIVTARRALLLPVGAAVVAVVVAVSLPTALHWRATHPYADTAARLVDADHGSGAGRLLQWRTSLSLWRAHPLFGVGPGHWAIVYPSVAADDDRTVARASFHPTGRLLTGDVVALVVERGVAGAVAVVGLVVVAIDTKRRRARLDLASAAGAAVALAIVATLDCVLQTACGAVVVAVVGALGIPRERRRGAAIPGAIAMVAAALGLAVATMFAADRQGAQQELVAARSPEALKAVAVRHPSATAPRFVLVEQALVDGDCAAARPWLAELMALRPLTPRVREAASLCATKVPR